MLLLRLTEIALRNTSKFFFILSTQYCNLVVLVHHSVKLQVVGFTLGQTSFPICFSATYLNKSFPDASRNLPIFQYGGERESEVTSSCTPDHVVDRPAVRKYWLVGSGAHSVMKA